MLQKVTKFCKCTSDGPLPRLLKLKLSALPWGPKFYIGLYRGRLKGQILRFSG